MQLKPCVQQRNSAWHVAIEQACKVYLVQCLMTPKLDMANLIWLESWTYCPHGVWSRHLQYRPTLRVADQFGCPGKILEWSLHTKEGPSPAAVHCQMEQEMWSDHADMSPSPLMTQTDMFCQRVMQPVMFCDIAEVLCFTDAGMSVLYCGLW